MPNDLDLECYFVAEDPRYPTLVITGDGEAIGFSYNRETKELERVCICAAHSESECLCGVWSINEAQ